MRVLGFVIVAMFSSVTLPACTGCTGMFLEGCKLKPVAPVPPADVPGSSTWRLRPSRLPAPDTAEMKSALDDMRQALLAVARAQQEARAQADRYSGSLGQLVADHDVSPREGVYVYILAATADGWAARAEHIRLPARTCVLWVGMAGEPPVATTAFERRRGDRRPGQPVCDGDDDDGM